MPINDLIKAAASPALMRASAQLAITEKLTKKVNSTNRFIKLFDLNEEVLLNSIDAKVFLFLKTNFWYFLKDIIKAYKKDELSRGKAPAYRRTYEITEDYLKEPYAWEFPGFNKSGSVNNNISLPVEIRKEIMKLVTKELADRLLVELANSSITKVVGIKVNIRT